MRCTSWSSSCYVLSLFLVGRAQVWRDLPRLLKPSLSGFQASGFYPPTASRAHRSAPSLNARFEQIGHVSDTFYMSVHQNGTLVSTSTTQQPNARLAAFDSFRPTPFYAFRPQSAAFHPGGPRIIVTVIDICTPVGLLHNHELLQGSLGDPPIVCMSA